MNKKSFKAFYRFKDLEHQGNGSAIGCLKEQFNIVQKVPDDGVEYEFMISFYAYRNRLDARAEIFDDSFVAFDEQSELFEELSRVQSITPDELEQLLVTLGYQNLTKEA